MRFPLLLSSAYVLLLAVAAAPSASAFHHDRDDNASLPTEVTCESNDQRQVSCEMDTRGAVEITRQLSRTRCVEGQNWGLAKHSVWVSDGCRAVFRNVSKVASIAPQGDTALGSCNVRKGAQGTLVTQVPVGDDYQELIVEYPDGRFMCMLRSNGQVQSLTPLKRR